MKVYEIITEDGRIVKGVNTTVDVGTNEIKVQAAKFGNTVDRDGHPPTLSKKVKGKSTNVLFNLGLTESENKQTITDKIINFIKNIPVAAADQIRAINDGELEKKIVHFWNNNMDSIKSAIEAADSDWFKGTKRDIIQKKVAEKGIEMSDAEWKQFWRFYDSPENADIKTIMLQLGALPEESVKERFASDAQRKAAFAAGYKPKGKKKRASK